MSSRLIVLSVVIAAFGSLTVAALLDVGYFGIIEPHFKSFGAAQVFVDLVIMGVLACVWMYRDAPRRGLSAWPFIAVTVVAGSFGPLAYLVVRELRAPAADPIAPEPLS